MATASSLVNHEIHELMSICSASERNKGIKLVLKICRNIINNPSQTEKYGDLHLRKINNKLDKCKPALNLLYIAGFKKSNNNTRLRWINTNNNMKSLINIYQTLQSLMKTVKTASNSDKKDVTMKMAHSDTYEELINLGFSEEEASTAISISNGVDSSQNRKVCNGVSTQFII